MKRYDPPSDIEGRFPMERDDKWGEYVLFTDHESDKKAGVEAALESERKKVERLVYEAKQSWRTVRDLVPNVTLTEDARKLIAESQERLAAALKELE